MYCGDTGFPAGTTFSQRGALQPGENPALFTADRPAIGITAIQIAKGFPGANRDPRPPDRREVRLPASGSAPIVAPSNYKTEDFVAAVRAFINLRRWGRPQIAILSIWSAADYVEKNFLMMPPAVEGRVIFKIGFLGKNLAGKG